MKTCFRASTTNLQRYV